MKLTVYDREVGQPQQKFTNMRDLAIGTKTPQAVSDLGEMLNQVGSEVALKLKAARDTEQYSSVLSEAKSKMAGYYANRSLDSKGYKTLADDTDDYHKTVSENLLDGVDDELQKLRIKKGLGDLGAQYHGQAVSDAVKQEITEIKGNMVVNRSNILHDSAYATEDGIRANILDYGNMLFSLSKAGVYQQDDAEKDYIAFQSDAVRAKVNYLINKDIDEAMDYLRDPTSMANLLEDEKKEKLVAQVNRMIETRDRRLEAERRQREADERRKLDMDRDRNYQIMYKGIRDQSIDVKLLDVWMMNGMFHKGDYDKLDEYRRKRGKEIVGNEQAFMELRFKAYMGDLATGDVMAAYLTEQINGDMEKTLIGEIEKGAIAVRTEGYKSALRDLKTKLGWNPNMGGLMPPNQVQLIGNASQWFRDQVITGVPVHEAFTKASEMFSLARKEQVEKPEFKTLDEAKARYGPNGTHPNIKQYEREKLRQSVHGGATQ